MGPLCRTIFLTPLRVAGVDRGMEPQHLLLLAMVRHRGRLPRVTAERLGRDPQGMARAKGLRVTGPPNKLRLAMAPKLRGTVPSQQLLPAMAQPNSLQLHMELALSRLVSFSPAEFGAIEVGQKLEPSVLTELLLLLVLEN